MHACRWCERSSLPQVPPQSPANSLTRGDSVRSSNYPFARGSFSRAAAVLGGADSRDHGQGDAGGYRHANHRSDHRHRRRAGSASARMSAASTGMKACRRVTSSILVARHRLQAPTVRHRESVDRRLLAREGRAAARRRDGHGSGDDGRQAQRIDGHRVGVRGRADDGSRRSRSKATSPARSSAQRSSRTAAFRAAACRSRSAAPRRFSARAIRSTSSTASSSRTRRSHGGLAAIIALERLDERRARTRRSTVSPTSTRTTSRTSKS